MKKILTIFPIITAFATALILFGCEADSENIKTDISSLLHFEDYKPLTTVKGIVGTSEEANIGLGDNSSEIFDINNFLFTYSVSPQVEWLQVNSVGEVTISSGAPLQSDANYTVTATVSHDSYIGSVSSTIVVAVVNPAPITGGFTYNSDNRVIVAVGGNVVVRPTWSDEISGQTVEYSATGLPTGISLDSTTGELIISSVATMMAEQTYEIKATGNGIHSGEITTSVKITVEEAEITGSFTYNTDNRVAVAVGGNAVVRPTWSDEISGQTVEYSATGLPTGISLDSTTGELIISSAATMMAEQTYEIKATGNGIYSGEITTSVKITVEKATEITGSFTYNTDNRIIAVVGGNATIRPIWSDEISGQTVEYSATGLPTGISLDSTTGELTISSAATMMAEQTYVVKATGNGIYSGEITTSVKITVEKATEITGSFTYNTDNRIIAVVGGNATIRPIWSDEISGQTVEYSTTGLPTGISLDSTTGELIISSEATTATMVEQTYVVKATGSGIYSGEITASVKITVEEAAANKVAITGKLKYETKTVLSAVIGTGKVVAMPTWTDHIEGQTVEYSSVPLPEGVTLDSTTGAVTLSEDFTSTIVAKKTYKITATGIGNYTGTINRGLAIQVTYPPITGTFPYPGNQLVTFLGIEKNTAPVWKDATPGQTVTYKIQGNGGNPPPGVSLDPLTGVVTVLVEADDIKTDENDASREWELGTKKLVSVQALGTGEFSGSKTSGMWITINPKNQVVGNFYYNSEILAGYTASLLPLWENHDKKQTVTEYSITAGTLPDGVTFDSSSGRLRIDVGKTKNRTLPYPAFTISVSGTGTYEGTLSTEVIISFLDTSSEIATIKEGKRGLPDYTKLHFDKLRFLPDDPADMTTEDRTWFTSGDMWKVGLTGVSDNFPTDVNADLEASMNVLRYAVHTRWFRNSLFSIFAFGADNTRRTNAAYYDIGDPNYQVATRDVDMTGVYMTIRNIDYDFLLAAKCLKEEKCSTATASIGKKARYPFLNIEPNYDPSAYGFKPQGPYIEFPVQWKGDHAPLLLHEMLHNMGYQHFNQANFGSAWDSYIATYRYLLAKNNEMRRVTFPDGIPNYLSKVNPTIKDTPYAVQAALYEGPARAKMQTYFESYENGEIPKYYDFSKLPVNSNGDRDYD